MNKKQIEDILKGMQPVREPVDPFSIHTEVHRDEKGNKLGTKITNLKSGQQTTTKKSNREIGNEDIQMSE